MLTEPNDIPTLIKVNTSNKEIKNIHENWNVIIFYYYGGDTLFNIKARQSTYLYTFSDEREAKELYNKTLNCNKILYKGATEIAHYGYYNQLEIVRKSYEELINKKALDGAENQTESTLKENKQIEKIQDENSSRL